MASHDDMVERKRARKNTKLQDQLDELLDVGARPRDPIEFEVGKPLPRHPEYAKCRSRGAFLEASYRGGARYKKAKDSDGNDVLVKHEQESGKAWDRRLRMSSCHNFCKPILDKLVGFVFSSPITRCTEDPFDEWQSDVDGQDMCLHEFMRRAVLMAGIMGKWFIQLDSTKPEDARTQAQAKAAGAKIVLTDLHPRRVLDWRKEPRQLLVADDTVGQYGGARLWTDKFVSVILLDKDGMVASIEPADLHGWEKMPIVEVTSHMSGESVIEDVAELQLSIFNMDSILKEELSKQTFSQWWLACPTIKPEDLQSVDVGSRKVLVLPVDANSIKFERLSGDTAQADSIRASIAADIQEIYRCMGLKDPTIEQGTESGRALKIRFTETAYIATSLADMAEDAEEQVTELWASAMGVEVEGPEYPDSFDSEDVAQELEASLKVITANFPASVKKQQVKKWVDDAFAGSVEQDDLSEMHEDIEALYQDAGPVEGEGEQGDSGFAGIDPAKLEKGANEEALEHPELGMENAKKIARDHLKADPTYYDGGNA